MKGEPTPDELVDAIVLRYRRLTGDDSEVKAFCVDLIRRSDHYTWNILRARLRENGQKQIYLDQTDLRGADMHQYDLRDAYLLDANLERANLDEAKLDGATCVGANLRGASIRWAQLKRTNFYDADLTGATVRRCICADTIFPKSFAAA